MSRPTYWRRSVGLILLIAIAAFALLYKLGAGSLAAWDEAIYAEVSKEVVQGSNWLTLHWQYAPWFEKPPLFIWMTAIVYRVSGVNEFAARVPSAISGLLLLFATYEIARTAYGKRAGLLAVLILLTSYHFISYSRFGTMEVMLTLFTYLAVYGYFRARENTRWWYLAWVACAAGVMAKGAGGFVGPAVIVLGLAFDQRLGEFRSRSFWQAGLLALALILPWHFLMYAWYGREFINEYIGYHVITRVTRTIEGNPSGYLYYVGRLIDGFFPFVVVAPFAIVSEIKKQKRDRSGSWILVLLPAFVFVFYTLIPTRRPWYIVALYPALAILTAGFVTRLYHAWADRRVYRRTITVVVAVLLVVGGSYSLLSLYLNRRSPDPIAKLAQLAQSAGPNDREPLILLANGRHYYAQVPLFYSNRPVLQAYDSTPPVSEDARRYVNFVRLADAVQASPRPIIFRVEDTARLAQTYEIEAISENDGLIYGKIKRKP